MANKKTKFALIFMFFVSVVFYGYFALKMDGIVFYPGDEARFLSIAKSIHFTGTISEHYIIKGYSDILYSMILSLVYFFYSPELVLPLFRLIGVAAMTSAVFPVYFLAEKINIGKVFKMNGSIFAAILALIIPELTYTAYLSEEVLLYPLFMWMLYLVYCEFEDENRKNRLNILLLILFLLMYAVKTFSVIFPAVYCLVIFLRGVKSRDKKIILKAVFSGMLFLSGIIGLHAVLFLMNGMQSGYSHYTDQALAIFPFSPQVLVGLIRGLLFYIGYFILFTGITPFIFLCGNIKHFSRKDKQWGEYLLYLILFTIATIVTIIHYSENGQDLIVSRFHYRYLFYFFVPMFMLFIKYKNIGSKIAACSVLAFETIVLSVFFIPVNQNGQGICDGIICYLVKSLNRYPGFTDSFYIIIFMMLIGSLILILKNKVKLLNNLSVIVISFIILAVLPYAIQIPLKYSNDYAKYTEDYIKTANYINSNAERVICLGIGDYSDPVMRAPAYNKKDFEELFLEEEVSGFEIEQDNTVILVMDNWTYGLLEPAQMIDLQTEYIRVYKVNRGMAAIDKNEYNIDFSSYSFLKEGYDEDGRRYLQEDGVSFGPYIKLSAGLYRVEIEGENLTNGMYASYSGNEQFATRLVEMTDTAVVVEISLPNDVDNFEFLVTNLSKSEIILDRQKIKKIG